MNQNNLRKLAGASCMTLAMIGLFSTSVLAADAQYQKNENIYVSLDAEGKENGVYVVNSFNVDSDGEIRDYGDYSEVLNLSNLDPIESDKDEQKFESPEGKFYYQGNLDKPQLPWTYQINYLLDGSQIDPEDLAGESGDLEITINIRKNPAYLDDTFFNTYLTQCSVTLDSLNCQDIIADNANISDAGNDTQITFTINPATETDLHLAASVTDFEMDNIAFTAIPATPVNKSFVSDKNTQMDKTTFIASVDGINIEDEDEALIAETSDQTFFQRLKDQLIGLFE